MYDIYIKFSADILFLYEICGTVAKWDQLRLSNPPIFLLGHTTGRQGHDSVNLCAIYYPDHTSLVWYLVNWMTTLVHKKSVILTSSTLALAPEILLEPPLNFLKLSLYSGRFRATIHSSWPSYLPSLIPKISSTYWKCTQTAQHWQTNLSVPGKCYSDWLASVLSFVHFARDRGIVISQLMLFYSQGNLIAKRE